MVCLEYQCDKLFHISHNTSRDLKAAKHGVPFTHTYSYSMETCKFLAAADSLKKDSIPLVKLHRLICERHGLLPFIRTSREAILLIKFPE